MGFKSPRWGTEDVLIFWYAQSLGVHCNLMCIKVIELFAKEIDIFYCYTKAMWCYSKKKTLICSCT